MSEQISTHHLMQYVNETMLPSLFPNETRQKISEQMAQQWLWKLGYRNTETKKGMYTNGHERPNVLAYRKKFIEYMSMDKGYGRYINEQNLGVQTQSYIRFFRKYDGDEMEPLPTVFADKEHIPVFQDESIFHTNEYWRRVWVKDGQQPLKKKGNGQAIHVSDFITEHGRLVLTEEEEIHNKACPMNTQVKSDA